jgi:Tfp pilus assembly protein PilF
MRLTVFAIVFLMTFPVLAQTTPYYPVQTTNGTTTTTTATPITSAIAPAPMTAPASTAAPTPVPTPPPATSSAPAGPTPIIQNLWRSDSGLDSAADLIQQRKYSDALPVLDLVIQRNMRNADAHVFSAICWANLGNMEKAKVALSNAFAIDKGHMGAYLVGGVIALQENDKTQANYYLSAIRTVCQGDICPEFQTLKKAINEAK